MPFGERLNSSFATDYVLRETDPVISMDIALGPSLEVGQTIEVDYAALRKTIEHVGAETNARGLEISLSKPNNADSLGQYDPYTNQMRIGFVPKPRKIAKTQKTLQHEMKHCADRWDLNNQNLVHQISYAIGSLAAGYGLRIMLPFAAVNAVNAIFTFDNEIDTQPLQTISETIDNSSTAIASISLALLAASLLYSQNKHERRAEKATKKKIEPVFTIGTQP